MEPLEKATVTAVLFADPAPAKTAVCLHRQDRKERWVLPPRQPAVRPGARDPGPRTSIWGRKELDMTEQLNNNNKGDVDPTSRQNLR